MHFAQKPIDLRNSTAVRGTVCGADVEEVAHVLSGSWDVSLVQLSSGRLSAEFDFLAGDGFVLYRQNWPGRVHANGTLWNGLVAFGVPESCGTKSAWWGRSLSEDRLPFVRSADELTLLAAPNEAITALVIRERDLESSFTRQTGRGPHELPHRAHLLTVDPADLLSLRRFWNRVLSRTSVGQPCELTLADIVTPLLGAFPGSWEVEQSDGTNQPMVELVLVAAERLNFRASVPELSMLLNLSRRTIECAFDEAHLGPPSAYFRQRRLMSCYSDLISADPRKTTVTTIAMRYGFTELGRFAAAYQRQFGELPSQTLRGTSSMTPARIAPLKTRPSDSRVARSVSPSCGL